MGDSTSVSALNPISSRGIMWALYAGVIAALSSIFGKLALSPQQQMWLCDWLDGWVSTSDCLFGYTSCDMILVTMRVANFSILLILGAYFWTVLSRALALCGSSAEATVVSTAVNFSVSGIAGKLLFSETLGLLWWAGASFVVIGLALIHQGSGDIVHKDKIS